MPPAGRAQPAADRVEQVQHPAEARQLREGRKLAGRVYSLGLRSGFSRRAVRPYQANLGCGPHRCDALPEAQTIGRMQAMTYSVRTCAAPTCQRHWTVALHIASCLCTSCCRASEVREGYEDAPAWRRRTAAAPRPARRTAGAPPRPRRPRRPPTLRQGPRTRPRCPRCLRCWPCVVETF